MGYHTLGMLHARLHHLLSRDADERGQGTVEYVALLFLVGAVFTAVVAAGKGHDFGVAGKIESTLKQTLDDVGGK